MREQTAEEKRIKVLEGYLRIASMQLWMMGMEGSSKEIDNLLDEKWKDSDSTAHAQADTTPLPFEPSEEELNQ